MRVNSTGLGKTTLIADFEAFETVAAEKLAGQYIGKKGEYLILGVESVRPVHWTIRITMDGKDMRKLIRKSLSLKVIRRVLWILARGTSLDEEEKP